jgi:hypothetical protein
MKVDCKLVVGAAVVSFGSGCLNDWAHGSPRDAGGVGDAEGAFESTDAEALDGSAGSDAAMLGLDAAVMPDGTLPEPRCDAGSLLCEGTCVSPDDPQHCGRCDRTCSSGTCMDGGCTARVVYRSQRTDDAGVPLPIKAFTVALDAVFVAPGGPLIERVRPTGGERTLVTYAGADDPVSLIADASGLFELAAGRVVSFAFGANASVQLVPASPGAAWHLTSNSNSLFWSWGLTQNHLSRVSKSGGKATILTNSPSTTFSDARVDESYAYYTDNLATVWRVPADSDGGVSAEQVGVLAGGTPRALALTTTSVLVATSDGVFVVSKVPGDSAAPVSPLSAYAVVADAEYAYVAHAVNDQADCSEGTELVAIRLSDPYPAGRVTTYSGGCANNLQQQGAALFWSDGSQLWRVEK